MHIIKNKFWFRFFLFTTLVLGSYNFFGQSLSFGYVQGYFGVTSKDAAWLLRGFQSGTIITGIAGLIFIKWIGNRKLFIGSSILLILSTIISFRAESFNVLLISRIAAGLANGFLIAVSTQLFLSTYEGKAKKLGALNSVAANIGGLCLGLFCNSLFTEDYGWDFAYFLSLPLLSLIFLSSFFFVPDHQKNEDIEEDWISLIPFSILIVSVFFIVLFREQYQGWSNKKIVISSALAVISACALLIRGMLHEKPLFDTRLLQYPGFVVALIISYLTGAAFVFNISMLAKLLGGILQMPMKDIFQFINLLSIIIFLSLVFSLVLIGRKFSPYWLLVLGLMLIAYTAFTLSKLNPDFGFSNIILPSLIGMTGCGMIAISIILVAVRSVPNHLVGKVANFRSVAFTMGIAVTATGLGRILNFENVRNFNLMIRYTDEGNPLLQERINGLKAFYMSNGYDADQAFDAAVNGITGMVKLQSFFLGLSETFFIGAIIAITLAVIVFSLWIVENRKLVLNFITFKSSYDEKLPQANGEV